MRGRFDMIDMKNERLLTLARAAHLEWLPERRFGKRLAPGTLYRWARQGRNGVRLEVVRVSGTLCTSEDALIRFFRRLADGAPANRESDCSLDHQHAASQRFLDQEQL